MLRTQLRSASRAASTSDGGTISVQKDLIAAADFYERGTKCYGPPKHPLGRDGYPHINQAFVEDLLAAAGDHPDERRKRADDLRKDILENLKPQDEWFNRATHIEAFFGLRQYEDATKALKQIEDIKPEPWQLRTTAEQLAHLAHLHEERPLDVAKIRTFFETLLPGAGDALRAVMIGKVGLALSGGGFRASFYHLGVLACLAERDILRDIEVLSCVSGGSIVGACYWLKLRERLTRSPVPTRKDHVQLVCELIDHFKKAVEGDPHCGICCAFLPSAFCRASRMRWSTCLFAFDQPEKPPLPVPNTKSRSLMRGRFSRMAFTRPPDGYYEVDAQTEGKKPSCVAAPMEASRPLRAYGTSGRRDR
jgi:hypothetical protein